jgi:hypothetical protein
MNHFGRSLVLVCAALFLSIAAGCKKPEPQATPQAATRAFYEARIASGAQGTPSLAELDQLTPYISVQLHDLLAEALLKHQRIASKALQKRRTFSEGDLFSSLYDGPTSLIVGEAEPLAGDEFRITVKLTSAKQLPALTWTDKVRVVREQGRYVVADIEFGNHWAFGTNTRLVYSLQSAMGKRTSV